MTKLSIFHLVQRHWSKYVSTKFLGHQILSVLSDTIPLQLILQCFTINSIFWKGESNPSSIVYCKITTRLYHKMYHKTDFTKLNIKRQSKRMMNDWMIQSMCTNDYYHKSIGKLVTLLFTAKVQGKWWKYKSNKLCLHPLNIPSLDIIPVSEMIYFFTMNSIPWRRGGNKGSTLSNVHYQTYIIKHQRWFSEVTLRYVRAIWEVWIYYICILWITLKVLYQGVQLHHKSLHISTATTSLNIDAKHTSIGYQVLLLINSTQSYHTSSTHYMYKICNRRPNLHWHPLTKDLVLLTCYCRLATHL